MSTDWSSPDDRRHAVRFAFPEPDVLPSPENASQPGNSFDWTGPSHQLGCGVMAAPTMDSLLQTVHSGLPGLAEKGLSPQYLIAATAGGVAALWGSQLWLAASDIVYHRTEEHVRAWVLSCSKDPLDLLVVAERAEADPRSPPANTGGRGRMRPRTHQDKIFPSGCLTLPPDGPSAILASGTSSSSLLHPVRPIPPYLGNFASQAFSHCHPPTVSFSIPPDVFSPPGRNPPFRPLPSRTL